MTYNVTYEWVREPMDEFGDIIDVDHRGLAEVAGLPQWAQDALAEHPEAVSVHIALVREEGNDAEGTMSRQWLYPDIDVAFGESNGWGGTSPVPKYVEARVQHACDLLKITRATREEGL